MNKKAGEFLKHHHFDEMASDLEEEEDDDETTDDKAWGKKKPKFYGTDFVGDNILGRSRFSVPVVEKQINGVNSTM